MIILLENIILMKIRSDSNTNIITILKLTLTQPLSSSNNTKSRSFHVIDNSRMPSAAHECHPHLTLDEIQTPLATTSQSSCSGTDSAIVPTAGIQSASMQEDQSNCQPMKQLTSSTHKNFED